MLSSPSFALERRTKRPDSFYLGLTVAGYVTLGIVLYCFGHGIVPFGYCVTTEMLHRPYAQDPQTLLCLIPAIIFGLLGVLQLRLDQSCSSAVNRTLLGISFKCNAIAVVGFCTAVALSGAENQWLDMIRLLLGLVSLGLFLMGIILTLTNLTWNLFQRA